MLAWFILILAWCVRLWPSRHREKVQPQPKSSQRGIWKPNLLWGDFQILLKLSNCGHLGVSELMPVEDFDIVRQQTASMVLDTKCASLIMSPDVSF